MAKPTLTLLEGHVGVQDVLVQYSHPGFEPGSRAEKPSALPLGHCIPFLCKYIFGKIERTANDDGQTSVEQAERHQSVFWTGFVGLS